MTEQRPAALTYRVHRTLGEDAPPAKEYVEYHWKRIFAALAVVTMLVTGAVYGVNAWLDGSKSPLAELPDAVESSEVQPTGLAIEIASEPSADRTPAVTAGPAPSPGPEPQGTDIAEPAPIGSGGAVSEAGATPDPIATADSSDIVATMPVDIPASDTATSVPGEPEVEAQMMPSAEQAPATSAPAMTADAAQVEILAPELARAQLTLGLEDKEPVDVLPRQLAMNDQGLRRVYLFTETRGLKDQLHFHDWYLNGTRVARIRIRPYSDQMRASSSKFIDRHMTGDWRVEVILESGERLASGAFVVLP